LIFNKCTLLLLKSQVLRAGLDILADAQQYMPWETPAFQIEPIFHLQSHKSL